jgi:hypothetical protein
MVMATALRTVQQRGLWSRMLAAVWVYEIALHVLPNFVAAVPTGSSERVQSALLEHHAFLRTADSQRLMTAQRWMNGEPRLREKRLRDDRVGPGLLFGDVRWVYDNPHAGHAYAAIHDTIGMGFAIGMVSARKIAAHARSSVVPCHRQEEADWQRSRIFELAGTTEPWLVALDLIRNTHCKPSAWGWRKPSKYGMQICLGRLSSSDAHLVWWTREQLLGQKVERALEATA